MNACSWTPPANLHSQNLLVVACTDHFFGKDYGQTAKFPQEWGLDFDCEFNQDLSLMEHADALWFHGPSITGLPEKKPGQKWILMCMESDQNYPFLNDGNAMGLFDIQMTYRLDSDVPTLYPNWRQYGSFLDPPMSIEYKNAQPSPVLYAASHPVAYRDDYVMELMKHIAVDSIGACLKNRDIEGFSSGTGFANNGFSSLLSVIRRYKFYLAFENSLTKDYVTERVFMALAAGAVPVYLGASNIMKFMPAQSAIICADDYESPQKLAEYLHFLDQDDAAYQAHLAWKTKGYSKQFRQLVDVSNIEPLARMFVKLAHRCNWECRCGGRME